MVLASLICAPQRIAAQNCESYISNDFPGVCQGGIWLQCDLPTDSVVWSNGVVAYGFSAPAGNYTYDAYANGAVVLAGEHYDRIPCLGDLPLVGRPHIEWVLVKYRGHHRCVQYQ